MKSSLSVIILSYNERLHIRRCIENVRTIASEIFVVDCHSSDGTQDIVRSCGATLVEHDWPGNQAEQMNWALTHLPIMGEWVLRLDADEYLSDALIKELGARLHELDSEVSGVAFPRKVVFLGHKLRFGRTSVNLLRLWRRGKAVCETKKMDEHMVVLEGRVARFRGEFIDHNQNTLVWWTQKHLGYAQRELADLTEDSSITGHLPKEVAQQRRIKAFYIRLPLFWRSLAYFLFRYFLFLGFLDGKAGFLWAFLQGLWYRTFVDALLFDEARRKKMLKS